MTTKAESAWMDAITQLGCIVCRNEGTFSPAMVHHIVEGGKRLGHLSSLPLCFLHHNEGVNCAEYVSRHPYKAEFERRYGTESELLEQVRQLVGEPFTSNHGEN